MNMSVPQDRDGIFEPKVVKKRQKDISGIEQKIISLYAKGYDDTPDKRNNRGYLWL